MSVETPVKRRPGGRSARVRNAVLAAATEILAADGYEGLTYDEVATRAGAHKTTLYRRWPTKADLVLDAMHTRSDLIIELPDTGHLERDLVAFLRTVVDNLTSPMGRSLVVSTMRGERESSDMSSLRHRFWDERFDRVRQRLERAKDAGQLGADTDVGVLAEALVSPIFFRALIRGESLDDKFLHSLVHQLIGNVAPPHPGRQLR